MPQIENGTASGPEYFLAERVGLLAAAPLAPAGPPSLRSGVLRRDFVTACRTRSVYSWVRIPVPQTRNGTASGPEYFLAERVGFEPTWGLRPQRISSPRRYDRFGTSPVGARIVPCEIGGCGALPVSTIGIGYNAPLVHPRRECR